MAFHPHQAVGWLVAEHPTKMRWIADGATDI